MKVRVPAIESVLHPSQRSVYRALRRFSVLEIGRRWGKTTFGIQLALDELLRKGRRVGWFAPTYRFLADPVREFSRALGPIVSKMDRNEMRLETSLGSIADFWSLDRVDAGRGRSYDLTVIDEAGFTPNLLEAWRASIRPTLADRRGRCLILGTPKGMGDFHRLYLEAEKDESGDWAAFRIGSAANPYIDPGEVEAARRSMPPEVFDQEFMGIPAEDGGNPFGLDAIRRCIGPLSTGKPEVWGVDLAKSNDWTVALALDASGAVCRLERWQGPWSVTRERLAGMIGQTPAQVDSTGVGDPIVEDLRKVCRRLEGFRFTSSTKQQLMEGLQLAVQTQDIRYPDGWLRAELESFGFRYTSRTVTYEATVGHDDGVCALALAVFGRRARRPITLRVI